MTILPEFTKAAFLVEQNKPLVVDRIKMPRELFVGQVLVKIDVSGICVQNWRIAGVKDLISFFRI